MDGVAANGFCTDDATADDDDNAKLDVDVVVVTIMDATDAANAAAASNHAMCVNDKLGRLEAAAEVTVCGVELGK